MSGRREVQRLRAKLDATFARAPAPTADPEFQADFAKYLCVLVSGYLESAICTLLLSYAQSRSAPEVSSFVERQLDRWTNPKTEKIVELFARFSPDWRDKLSGYLVDERRDSINSLVALRHKIAHGESVGTSLSQIREHYKVINEVVDYVTGLLGQ